MGCKRGPEQDQNEAGTMVGMTMSMSEISTNKHRHEHGKEGRGVTEMRAQRKHNEDEQGAWGWD
jgi:hypothetical protein